MTIPKKNQRSRTLPPERFINPMGEERITTMLHVFSAVREWELQDSPEAIERWQKEHQDEIAIVLKDHFDHCFERVVGVDGWRVGRTPIYSSVQLTDPSGEKTEELGLWDEGARKALEVIACGSIDNYRKAKKDEEFFNLQRQVKELQEEQAKFLTAIRDIDILNSRGGPGSRRAVKEIIATL